MNVTQYKTFEILKSLPTYGPMYIPISQNGKPFYYEGLPVRFYKSDGNSWVANFESGITDFSTIFELETPYLLAISSGKCFIINPDKVQPIEIFGGDYINYLTSNDGRIILYSNTHVTITNSKGNHWDSEQISVDGLAKMKISKNNIITGLFYEPTPTDDLWIPFEYNINTKSLLYDKNILKLYYKKFENSCIKNKNPWWKFW